MSVVTSVILTTSCAESVGYDDPLGPAWRAVQAWLEVHDFAPLAMLDQAFSGTKAPEILVGGGAYNYFPHEEFGLLVTTLEWEWPENVVLVMKPQEGETIVLRSAAVSPGTPN